ncbi:YihY/virulence factor BrkB family protein [Segetibacter aerophilus]|uniref:Uncharacterized protein n=1 Tax=Segetibacter aerophilus TaxID=670293 RepID=A0A512BJW7_9BACT|nr:YihY/virulence factor BrkB family protein [Segetibacter aerophilus]GEO12271.1 hypothetical protein SAE01_47670 [Segetibacter aerophilus]
MKGKLSFVGMWDVLKSSFKGMGEDKITKMAGSLAYYTVFSLAPLLIMVISLCGIFLGREAVEGQIYGQLKNFVGADTAAQMQEIIKNASLTGKSRLAVIIGSITLLIGATTVFAEIQDSINTIWGLKPKPKKGWLKMLQNRFLSFSVIASLGFLLLVSLGVTALIDGLSDHLKAYFPDVTIVIFTLINILITLIVTALIFAVIFKVLPDAKIKWRDVFAGAIATSLLFMVGRFGISIYISKSNIGSTYGTAGSLVVLLIWVYYSSIILYFGAEFTKSYALKYGAEIHPDEYAVTTKVVEVENGDQSVQATNETDVTQKTEATKKAPTVLIEEGTQIARMSKVNRNNYYNVEPETGKSKKVVFSILAASSTAVIIGFVTRKRKETNTQVIRSRKSMVSSAKEKVNTIRNIYITAKEGAEDLLKKLEQKDY